MKSKMPRRLAPLTALVLALVPLALLVGSGSAKMPPTETITVKPGKHAGDQNPHVQPHGGTPGPGKLGHVVPARKCLPGVEKKGTKALQRFVDHWWIGRSDGINNCRDIHDTNTLSTHSEGRAFDWHLDVNVKKQRKAARAIIRYFLRADSYGKKYAMARRWGVELIIYNNHIWSVTHPEQGMRPCGSSCSDHYDHLHIEQNWRGAKRKTSAYKGWTFTVPAT